MVASIVIGAHPKRQEPGPIEFGAMLSRLTQAELHVVGTYWFDNSPKRTALEDHRRSLADEARETLARAGGDFEGASERIRVHVASGSAAHALQQTASDVGAGLIVVGSTHKGSVGRIALGSTADRVLDGAPCPVAIVPSGYRDEGASPQRVGVAFVDTPGGWSALRAGAALARQGDATLVVYTVTEPHANDTDRDRAEDAIERAVAESASGVNVEARMLSDRGTEALVAQSAELDVLLRGCRAPGPMRPPLALEVASKLARQVACPLIIVAPGLDTRFAPLFDTGVGADRHGPVAA